MISKTVGLIIAVAVALIVGISAWAFGVIKSTNQPPHVQGVMSASITVVGREVDFNITNAWDPDGDVLSGIWYFGDGNNSEGLNVSHAYMAPGEYFWTVVVDDGHGHTDDMDGTTKVLGNDDLVISVLETGRCTWDSSYPNFPFINVTVWNNASFTLTLYKASFLMENSSGAWFESVDEYTDYIITLPPGTNMTWSLMFYDQASGDPVVLKYFDLLEWPVHWA